MKLAALIAAVALSSVTGASLLRKAADVPKPDPVIKNPVDGVPVGDVVPNAEPPDPKGQQYELTYAPQSPQAAKDLSPTDPSEYLSDMQGQVADMIDTVSTSEGRRFEGSTCKGVCSACSIYASQQDGGMCFCYATCKMGECGNGALPHIGWSNNEVTSPRTLWQATCNVGEKNCESQCMEDELKKQIKKCEDSQGNPTECYRKLVQRNQPLPHDARKQVHFCAMKGMLSPEKLRTVPADKRWMCFSSKDKADAAIRAGISSPGEGGSGSGSGSGSADGSANVIAAGGMQAIEAPSVWMNVDR